MQRDGKSVSALFCFAEIQVVVASRKPSVAIRVTDTQSEREREPLVQTGAECGSETSRSSSTTTKSKIYEIVPLFSGFPLMRTKDFSEFSSPKDFSD